jgi:pimeloyl-ACP methyl ester carboxylesterase
VARWITPGGQWLTEEEIRVPVERGALCMTRTRGVDATCRGAALLLHGFAQNRHAWDLPRRSFVVHLAERGFDVFNLELRGHGRSRRYGTLPARGFEEYVERDLPAAIARLVALGHERFFLVGHSLGGAVAYATAPAQAARVRGVVTFSGVFRWGGGTRAIAALSRLLSRADAVQRRLGWKRGPSVRLDVAGHFLARRLRGGRSADLRIALQGWVPGSIEDEVLEQWLSRSLDRASSSVLTMMGRWGATDRFCDSHGADYEERWARCGLPVLVVAADRDRLAHPLRDVKPAYDVSTSADRQYQCFGVRNGDPPTGHVDLVVGRHAPKRVWPFVSDWMEAR